MRRWNGTVQWRGECRGDCSVDDRQVDQGPASAAVVSLRDVGSTSLLAAGADPNARDDRGFTPLLRAVELGWGDERLAELLAADADVSARTRAGRWIARLQRDMGIDDANRRIEAALGRGAT